MIYIPIRSDAAANLSRAIYQLTRPPAVRNPADVSCYYCEWIQHPTRAEVALVVFPESEEIPVHVQADGALLESTLAPFVGVELTQQEADAINGAVQALAGHKVDVADLIPASWQPYVMDYATALATGWIPQPQSLP